MTSPKRPRVICAVCAVALFVGLQMAAGCKRKDPLYCDEQTMCLAGYEACDLTAACSELRNTCLAPEEVCWDAALPSADAGVDAAAQACFPDAFIRCDSSGDVVACNAGGTAEVTLPCDGGCNQATMSCNDCVPNSSVCDSDTLTVCSSTGAVLSTDPCALGCHAGGARCNDLAPSNGLGVYLDDSAAGPDLVLVDGSTVDTGTGVVMNGSSPVSVPSELLDAPAGGVPVRVFKVSSFRCGDLAVTGAPALALVSNGDVDVLGHVILAASPEAPGAFNGSSTCHGTDMDIDVGLGGAGGAGHGGPGAGGGSSGAVAGRAGGTAASNQAIVPLRGGCWGGTVSNFYPPSMLTLAVGGRGGGAVQIASRTRIRVGEATAGSIQVDGFGGKDYVPLPGGGAGGGSGGAILLEAPVVVIAAVSGLSANGGAGSCAGMNAADGAFSLTPAPGSDCTGDHGDGGAGGTSSSTPGTGANGSGSDPRGGGGGGAVGRVRVNTSSGSYSSDGTAILSPDPSTGVAATR